MATDIGEIETLLSDALRVIDLLVKDAIVVAPHLRTPYPDKPVTPWQLSFERSLREVDPVRERLRAVVHSGRITA